MANPKKFYPNENAVSIVYGGITFSVSLGRKHIYAKTDVSNVIYKTKATPEMITHFYDLKDRTKLNVVDLYSSIKQKDLVNKIKEKEGINQND